MTVDITPNWPGRAVWSPTKGRRRVRCPRPGRTGSSVWIATLPASTEASRRPGMTADRAKILVLSTTDDTSDEVLGCGEVLSTVLLEATMADLATCPLSHMIELAASREMVCDLIGRTGLPHLLRVGRAEPDVEFLVTPRRRVVEVLESLGRTTGSLQSSMKGVRHVRSARPDQTGPLRFGRSTPRRNRRRGTAGPAVR